MLIAAVPRWLYKQRVGRRFFSRRGKMCACRRRVVVWCVESKGRDAGVAPQGAGAGPIARKGGGGKGGEVYSRRDSTRREAQEGRGGPPTTAYNVLCASRV